jgi:putative DNA primase/helicase
VTALDDIRVADRQIQDKRLLPAPGQPMPVAREFAAARFAHPDGQLLLRHWRGDWWLWRDSHWQAVENGAVREAAYRFTEHAHYEKPGANGPELVACGPNKTRIANLLEALAAVCHLGEETAQPSWLRDGERPEGTLVACGNGLLEVGTRRLWPHDPAYFNSGAVPFEYDPYPLAPERWEQFLEELWGDDQRDQILALQEWLGYLISGRTDLHKVALMIGPTRSGRGTIARLIRAMMGEANYAGPTLNSLGGEFGLEPLIGRSVGVVSDARLNKRNTQLIVERLLSISGEDALSVNRKNKQFWTGKLPTRFTVISNELPALEDASGAVAGRFITFLFECSWWGKEDLDLTDTLIAELPGIFNWALDGLERLTTQRHFTRTKASDDAFRRLQDLASPIRAFLRDCCITGSGCEVEVDEFWAAWKGWADANGQVKGTKQTLGKHLSAAEPRVKFHRRGPRGDQVGYYAGVGLA